MEGFLPQVLGRLSPSPQRKRLKITTPPQEVWLPSPDILSHSCMKMVGLCQPGAASLSQPVPAAWLLMLCTTRSLFSVLPTYLKYLMNILNGYQWLVCLLENKGENIWVICSLFCKTITEHLVASPEKEMKAEGYFTDLGSTHGMVRCYPACV